MREKRAPLARVCSFIKVLISELSLSGRLRELKNKGKVQLGNP